MINCLRDTVNEQKEEIFEFQNELAHNKESIKNMNRDIIDVLKQNNKEDIKKLEDEIKILRDNFFNSLSDTEVQAINKRWRFCTLK